MFPYGKKGNMYILSNEVGFNSLWVEGSIENVDYFLNKMYNTPLFGPPQIF